MYGRTSLMKINIVTEVKPGWVLRRLAEELCEELPNCTTSESDADLSADVNIYFNHALFKHKTKGIDIVWCTHLEEGYEESWNQIAEEADYILVQSKQQFNNLPKEKTFIMNSWVDKQFVKEEIVFGLVGREYGSKRKRYHWIEKLNNIPRAKFLFTGGITPFEELPQFYKKIDYLLITSKYEGGPLPVIEAIAMGVPVISTNVGYAWEFPAYKYNTFDELRDIITKLTFCESSANKTAKMIMEMIK
jgi:hypothetical protein